MCGIRHFRSWFGARGKSARFLPVAKRAAVEALERRMLLSTVVVNTIADATDASGSGTVSLRDAIATANASSAPTTITFDSSVFAAAQTIELNGTPLELRNTSAPTTIDGPAAGVTISGNDQWTTFVVDANVNATLSGLTITDDVPNEPPSAPEGVYSSGMVTLSGDSFSGGGVVNNASMTVSNTSIANFVGYGVDNGVGATVSVSDVTIYGLSAYSNYGIYNSGAATVNGVDISHIDSGIINFSTATATVNNVDISGCLVEAGIINTGQMTVTNSTVSGGLAFLGNTSGGGIRNGGIITITNVTVANNVISSNNTAGAGIYNSGNATVSDVTVFGNTFTGSGGSGGGICNQGTLTLANSIVAGDNSTGSGPDVSGSFNSLGHNLIGATDGSSGWTGTDLTGTSGRPLNPDLGALANNGGPTQTLLPQSGSPAIDAGSNALIPNGVTTDQCGLPRIVNGIVDIGAVEVQAATGTSITVASPADQAANAGQSKAFNLGSFTQVNAAAPYSVDVNWGDGANDTVFSVTAAGAIPAKSHTYTSSGDQTVTVTVTDSANHVSNSPTFTVDVAAITVSAPAAQTASAGQSQAFALGSFAASNATGPYTVTVNWGDGSADSQFSVPAAATIPAQTHTYTSSGNDTVSVTVTDSAGHTSNSSLSTVDVAAITAVAAAAQSANAGQSQSFTLGSFTEFNATGPYNVDVNWGDGTTDSIFTLNGTGPIPATAHTYANSGNDTVSITVTDAAGHTSNTPTFTVDVAAITATPSAPQAANTGQSPSFALGNFSQSNATGPYSVDVNWGDGTTDSIFSVSDAGPMPATAHTFTSIGDETVSITVRDAANHTSNTATFTVDVASITATAPAAQAANTGINKPFALGSFRQINATGPFTVTVNWGDGSDNSSVNVPAAGTIPTTAHVFAASGNQTVTVTITDSAGHSSESTTFTVNVAAITVSAPATQFANAGQSRSFTPGNFSQANTTGPFTATVNWGDGSGNSSMVLNAVGAIPAAAHTYTASGNQTVTVTVADSAGHIANPTTFTIDVAALTVAPPGNQTAAVGQSRSVNLGNLTQANATGPYSVDVNWGDGSADSKFTLTAAGAIPATTHIYTAVGNDTVSIIVTDAANHTSNSPTFTVAVGPATPVFGNLTVAAGIPQGTATVAFSGSIAAATFIPPGNEVVAITLDGVTQDAAINAQGNFTSTFNTSQLIASFTPYPVTYAYAGDANFRGIANSTTTKLTVNGVEEPVYRIYSPVTTEHLYTADLNEYDTLATRGWTQEGVAFDWYSGPITLDGVDAEPMYRLYNAADQQHLWTSALNEYNTLKAVTGMWSAEGIVGYVFPTAVASSAPLYRLIYPFAADMHLWTTNLNEINTLISQDGWTEEGIAGYVL